MSSFDETPMPREGACPTPLSGGLRKSRMRRVAGQQALALPPVEVVDPSDDTQPQSKFEQLWLCIYLLELPLDTLRGDGFKAFAVFDEEQGLRRVLMADAEAQAAGIEPGMSVNAALSLLPGLVLEPRDPQQESLRLKQLAVWMERFTSFVVIEGDNALLLEVAGSLHLFGGLARIQREIERGLAAKGLTALTTAAPTPLAAVWLARAGWFTAHGDMRAADVTRLAKRLRGLPLVSTGWPTSVTEKMQGMGIRQVGDCLRLPRQGFARRFGVRFLNELDRAMGRLPDPREHFRLPDRFSADHEFEAEQSDSDLILHGCRELLVSLERFLRVRQRQIQQIRFSFFHLRADATHLTLGCVRAGQGVEHWFDLLRIRFEQIVLPEPAIAVRLRSGCGESATMQTSGLLEATEKRTADAPIEYLVERLNARIGEDAVHGVALVAEHRPHRAWRKEPPAQPLHCRITAADGSWNERDVPRLVPDSQQVDSLLLRRPLWILDRPEHLRTSAGRPLYQGRALVLESPERLESGWWDDEGIARDYFIARDDEGACLWIYRDRRSSRIAWYLHGMFG